MLDTRQPSILIGDDHTLVAEAIKNLLVPEFNVVGLVADGRALVDAAVEKKPDVVIVDISMPRLNGLDATHRIKHAVPETKIICLTMNGDPDIATAALKAGASAVVLKKFTYTKLVTAIREALSEGRNAAVAPRAPELPPSISPASPALTARQRDVLQLLAEGLSIKEVGAVLSLATRTVAFHKNRLMRTLGLANDASLVQFAVCNRLLFIEDPVKLHSPDRRALAADGQEQGTPLPGDKVG